MTIRKGTRKGAIFGMTGMSYIWSESSQGRICQRILKRLARFLPWGVGERGIEFPLLDFFWF